MKIKVIKFDNYKAPERAHYNDSGADIFAAEERWIEPHTVYAMPTGVGIELPDGYDAVIHCKSGLSKSGLWADNPIYVKAGQKIGQLVVRPVIYAEYIDELGDERGEGAFGSTGI